MFRSAFILLICSGAYANGTLSDDLRISSNVLGYDLQYRVYLPEGYEASQNLPVLFLVDGQVYLSRGRMPVILDGLIGKGIIDPLVAVFVDARDPNNLRSNRRNAQFLCNPDYLQFFVDELIPTIEERYSVADERSARTIMGLSFGATNAACFGIQGSAAFSGLAMQSPANHPLPDLVPAYEKSPRLPLNIFLSTGKPDDNTLANRKFHRVLKDKGYDMQYVEVREGHNWKNWRPLLDDVLRYFYSANQ